MNPDPAADSTPSPAPPTDLAQRVDLPSLVSFVGRLRERLRNAVGAEELVTAALSRAVQIACPQCGLELTTEDLDALAAEESGETTANAKVQRLRQGYCGRNGCNAFIYQFTFNPYPGVDWPAILGEARTIATAAGTETAAATVAPAALPPDRRRQRLLRMVIGVGIALVLFLVRQWYYSGGRIPFIREPRQFQAAPAPSTSVAPAPATAPIAPKSTGR
jgi:hypothetical protein